ncbi:hypothetical protein [Mesorhizobium atlanticum]|uniref:Protein argonaute n=1 Tax=Mesorhizobium atlanticum TaxID=2233532 RepID=A0A330GKG2_9HYPH|nr:hypothetical protein [Mesorhizobium atlanticum]RAZ72992.1 hypothetical protein DPM35_26770 [Mesorhizobium atlanticum]
MHEPDMLETNLYRLGGLETVVARYRLFEIMGNDVPGSLYYAGVTRLQRTLTRQYQRPFAILQRGDTMNLAVPEDVADNIALHHNLVRWVASLEPVGDTVEIDCSADGDALDPIRLRFLNFIVQTPLYKNNGLWRPRSGDAFYHRDPASSRDGVEIFEGVSLRVVPYPRGGFGILLEAKTKLISARPIGAGADQNTIRGMKGSSCLYRMGDQWFEIKISGAGRSVSDPILFENGKAISLKEYLHKNAQRPIPKILVDLKGDGAVVNYRGSETAQVKAAPAELCFPVLDTHSKRGAYLQRQTIQSPGARRSKVFQFKRSFLDNIIFGNARITVADHAAELTARPFALPDILFGGGRRLYGTNPNGGRVDVRDYAKSRRRLLEQKGAGFYEASPLEPQVLIMPQSVMNAWGPAFVEDLQDEVARLYPGGGYRPKVLSFNDLSAPVNSANQAKAILELAQTGKLTPGDCAIMLHASNGRARMQDKLPALLMNKLRTDYGINAAVFHATTPDMAYQRVGSGADAKYVRKPDPAGRFAGYLTGAALNKILIPNAKWPFVLAAGLAADVVIGIDVKHQTAGIVLVADGGRIIRHKLKTSSKHEKLSAGIVESLLTDMLRSEAQYLPRLAKRIVVHRDGRVFPSEIAGLQSACRALAQDGHICEDFELSVFEIGKTSPAPLRLFKVHKWPAQKPDIFNPGMGEWMVLSEGEGHVCTTGWPLLPGGTARPLHVTRAAGTLSMEDALHDIFRLSCLTWTRPESCSRLPVSLKLCDTFLKDEGAEHDEDDMLHESDSVELETA